MPDSPFAARHFGLWLDEASPVARQNRVDILDLFYWEQRMGSWQAMSQLEWDIVQEEFTPFNCRELLSLMLGVDERYRKPPGYAFHRQIIRNLWPETLKEPINPKPLEAKLKKDIPHRLRASALFQLANRARRRVFRKSAR
jgi:hypothetical protein